MVLKRCRKNSAKECIAFFRRRRTANQVVDKQMAIFWHKDSAIRDKELADPMAGWSFVTDKEWS
jgi:hypothetical protein